MQSEAVTNYDIRIAKPAEDTASKSLKHKPTISKKTQEYAELRKQRNETGGLHVVDHLYMKAKQMDDKKREKAQEIEWI